MKYEFSMEKPTAIKVIAGMGLVGVLLFAAGIMVGLQWNQPRPELSSATAGLGVSGKNDSAELPLAKTDFPAEPEQVSPAAPSQEVPSGTSASAQPGGNSAVASAGSADASGATGKAAESKPPATTSQPSQPNYSVSVTPNAIVPDAPPVRAAFDVQVGAFAIEQNALGFREELMRKGYSVTIVEVTNAEMRQLYAVRLGPYTNQTMARRAAANFAQQEKIKAIVRPSGTF